MILVQKVDVDEALSESVAHQNFILTIFLLLVFIVTISFIAIWRHATSLRLQKAARRLEARAALLNAIGDSIKPEENTKGLIHIKTRKVENDVEIGANSTIDRATLGITIIKEGKQYICGSITEI